VRNGKPATVEAEMLTRENLRQIWATVDELPGRQRTIFMLRFVEEMQVSEIAETTGLNLSTVKSLLYRTLRTVRAAMGKDAQSSGAPRLGQRAMAAESIRRKPSAKVFSAELAVSGSKPS
jgi:DNA-directed RNA polymerase sigma subunit (sigma70/sigma32)